MIKIVKANENDFRLLAETGKVTFIESHGASAPAEEINKYVNEKYDPGIFKEELRREENIFHIIYYDNDIKPAGYSKIILNSAHPDIPVQNVTKMERLYLLKEFYDLKLGFKLFDFNLELSKKNGQKGMWLFVWKENRRAVSFYEKAGFKITGSHNFKLTETHSNPNHQMFLKY